MPLNKKKQKKNKKNKHTREYTNISEEEIEIIMACRKSILTNNWITSTNILVITTLLKQQK